MFQIVLRPETARVQADDNNIHGNTLYKRNISVRLTGLFALISSLQRTRNIFVKIFTPVNCFSFLDIRKNIRVCRKYLLMGEYWVVRLQLKVSADKQSRKQKEIEAKLETYACRCIIPEI